MEVLSSETVAGVGHGCMEKNSGELREGDDEQCHARWRKKNERDGDR